ncbi:MAG: helix-turn-helix domain-containing protein [Oscillospiraceae bacterium]|nr:helix-turn-helix domain-containing protein [Oscillospiraceae bacterium]
MLTIKECSEAVKGLSEHTVRQLVAQEKIPYIRTGQSKRGKILISRTALLEYLGGAA